MEIEFKGRYNKAQFFKGVYLAAKPSNTSTVLRVVAFLVFAGVLIALAVTTYQDDPAGFQISRLPRHFGTALILGYLAFQPFISMFFTARGLWDDQMAQNTLYGKVTNQGITLGGYPQTWDRFVLKRFSEEFVVLQTTNRSYTLLQRNFFKAEEDWHRVVKLIEHKVVEPK